MHIDDIRSFCSSLPAVTEDVKWGNDLCFSIGGKMFCITGLNTPVSMSFKVQDEQFHELSSLPHFKPAPYLARHHWVYLDDVSVTGSRELKEYIKGSYELIKSKLPKKTLKEIEGK